MESHLLPFVLICIGIVSPSCKTTAKLKNTDFATARMAYSRSDFKAALDGVRLAAEQGNVEAQAILGHMYARAQGVPQSYADALKWYRAAADRQNDYAENAVGSLYQLGQGVSKDSVEAAKWFRLASGHGNADASFALGGQYYSGDGVSKDYRQAITFWLLADKQGEATKKSERLLKDGLGPGLGRANAEVVFMRGEGLPDNPAEAERWLRFGADNDLAAAETRLGMTYYEAKNYPAALTYLQRAASRSDFNGPKTIISLAQYSLATMYYNGEGVGRNYSEAAKWLRLSADQGFEKTTGEHGYARAQYQMGVMYMNGKGVLQDYSEAIRFYRLAADQGDRDAQLALGAAYFAGRGTPQNYIQAHLWLNLAAAAGNNNATKLRYEAERLMTGQQVAEAQKLARDWKPKQDEKGWVIIE